MEEMFDKYTMTLYEALDKDPTLLDDLILDTPERTQQFKDMFLGKWGIYGIGAETIALFKLYIKGTYLEHKDYYIEQLQWQDNKISLDSPTYQDEIDVIDLPNKQSTGEYITSKEKRFGNNTMDLINRKLVYRETIRNIMLDFVERFRECMNMLYY